MYEGIVTSVSVMVKWVVVVYLLSPLCSQIVQWWICWMEGEMKEGTVVVAGALMGAFVGVGGCGVLTLSVWQRQR